MKRTITTVASLLTLAVILTGCNNWGQDCCQPRCCPQPNIWQNNCCDQPGGY